MKTKRDLFIESKKEVDELNKIFQKASLAEKRVMIAKDVLVQIELNKYYPSKGTYMSLSKKFIRENENLQDILLVPSVSCNVCAIGSAFASCIRIENKYKIDINDIDHTSLGLFDMKKFSDAPMMVRLFKYFSLEQLDLIEWCFEGWYNSESSKENAKIRKFCDKYYNTRDRLVAIMKNIIKNKGLFKL